jgi:acyl-CoA thioesterase FadM
MSGTQVYPVVTRTEVDYKLPAKLGDWLVIRGRLDEMSRARFWCAFEMVRESDGALLVTARQALALVQMPAGKPMRLPAEWAQRWA